MAGMHKGPRRGFQVRWTEEDRREVQRRASASGLTMNDYLLSLVHRDVVDADGRPTWLPTPPADQTLLNMSA